MKIIVIAYGCKLFTVYVWFDLNKFSGKNSEKKHVEVDCFKCLRLFFKIMPKAERFSFIYLVYGYSYLCVS